MQFTDYCTETEEQSGYLGTGDTDEHFVDIMGCENTMSQSADNTADCREWIVLPCDPVCSSLRAVAPDTAQHHKTG